MPIDTQIARLDEIRTRLYRHVVGILLVAVGMCAVYAYIANLDAIPPSGPWFRDLISVVVPSIAPSIVELPSRYPILSVAFAFLIVTLGRALLVLTHAMNDISWALHQGAPRPGMPVWSGVIPRFRWFVVVVGIVTGIMLVDLRLGTACHADCGGVDASESAECGDARGGCRLGPGQTSQVTMRADSARNATGILLEAGALYTARYVRSDGWQDKDICVRPSGFRFCQNIFGLSRFWWMEWLRPHPKGEWFEVLGRIDQEKFVFPLLDPCDAAKPWPFTAAEDGELVLLVNDVIYGNNAGVMTLEIKRQVETSSKDLATPRRGRHCRPPFERGCRHR